MIPDNTARWIIGISVLLIFGFWIFWGFDELQFNTYSVSQTGKAYVTAEFSEEVCKMALDPEQPFKQECSTDHRRCRKRGFNKTRKYKEIAKSLGFTAEKTKKRLYSINFEANSETIHKNFIALAQTCKSYDDFLEVVVSVKDRLFVKFENNKAQKIGFIEETNWDKKEDIEFGRVIPTRLVGSSKVKTTGLQQTHLRDVYRLSNPEKSK